MESVTQSTIEPEDARYLERNGLLSTVRDCTRKISSSVIFALTSSQADDSGYAGSESSYDILILEKLISLQTYEWLGFNSSMALTLRNRFMNLPVDASFDFLDVALYHVANIGCVAASEEDDWDSAFQLLGVQ